MIVDANVLVSAVLGRSMPLLFEMIGRGHNLLMPAHQYAEAKLVIARKMGWQGQAVDGIAAAILNVVPPLSYAGDEVAARERLTPRGQPDWPVLAAAIAFDDEIWSNDRDFFGVGVPVWSTPNIQFSGLGRG